jgi:hypothetical protein
MQSSSTAPRSSLSIETNQLRAGVEKLLLHDSCEMVVALSSTHVAFMVCFGSIDEDQQFYASCAQEIIMNVM